MRSRIAQLPAGPCTPEVLRAAAGDAAEPDLVLGFLPPDEQLAATLAALAALWPGSLRFGCEAGTQVAGAEVTRRGSLQLFWFDGREHGAALDVIEGSHAAPPPAERAAALARRLSAADGALLLVDGERFPTERFLAELRHHLGAAAPRIAGGLAAPLQPASGEGTRVFFRERVLPAACLALLFHGLDMHVEVVRGWGPASPVYTVDRAAGNVLWEIDGAAATDWYHRFFTANGALAPMPESAHRFPLLVEGPKPERQGLYRSMRRFDEPPGSVTFWGSVETGDRVRLAMRNGSSLPGGAALPSGTPPEAAILCAWGGSAGAATVIPPAGLPAVHETLGGAPLSGLLTCAEIGPTARGDLALYNQTAVLALLAEKRA